MSIRKFLLFFIFFLNVGTFAASADTPDQTLYQTITESELADFYVDIPTDLEPGFRSITVLIENPNGPAREKTLLFCKNLIGEIHWNNKCPDLTPLLSQSKLESIKDRSALPKYNPLSEPKKTTDIVIVTLAAMTVATGATKLATTNVKQQGYLAQVAKGGGFAVAVVLGRGDQSRINKAKRQNNAGTKFSSVAQRRSAASPLFARILEDGNYLRATIQHLALGIYPVAVGYGAFASTTVDFQALPPSVIVMMGFLILGIIDSLAGLSAVLTFGAMAIATGHLQDLSSFLTLVGIGLVGFSPILLASVFRPLRRPLDGFANKWERASDYLIAALLTGWVVKQIVSGLSGLSGLQLPITSHAHQIGIVAGILVALRFMCEDIVGFLYPQRLQILEPSYQERTSRQSFMTIAMKITVFLLVAEPFFGLTSSLWIGVTIFATPQLLGLWSAKLPKNDWIGRMVPKGIIEMLVMTTAGFLIAKGLTSYPSSASGYVLTAFILLGLPGFTLNMLGVFKGENAESWKVSPTGKYFYRIGGVVALGTLTYVIFSGILLSNNL
jgi:hypothetical protein